MDGTAVVFTVYFDDPFWVGVFEKTENGELSVCKVTFGAEPKDQEVWEFVLRHYYGLKFSPPVKSGRTVTIAENPKRRQREVKKQLRSTGIGTRSQQALAAMREEIKTERRRNGRERREAEQERRFELRRQKRKDKHRGH